MRTAVSPEEIQLQSILNKYENAVLRVFTLGKFEVWLENKCLQSKDWGRDKSIQLFQFLVTSRFRKALHKEQILDRLWEEDGDTGDQIFKVALHGLNKALEPNRKKNSEMLYISRSGLSYQLNRTQLWIDCDIFEDLIGFANATLQTQPKLAKKAYQEAIQLNKGEYLPDRIFEDWSCDERERLQILALGSLVILAELYLPENPLESIRLSQQALLIDSAWEDAYRIQMEAYFLKGNRPMAIKTFELCEKILKEEMNLRPLPETIKVFDKIMAA